MPTDMAAVVVAAACAACGGTWACCAARTVADLCVRGAQRTLSPSHQCARCCCCLFARDAPTLTAAAAALAAQAAREAAERLIANHAAVARFAARGAGRPGFPPVAAPLSDPNAVADDGALEQIDIALRHTVHALLAGHEAAAGSFTAGLDAPTAVKSLGYLRDRISVPRDMCYPAARTLRAHLNWSIEMASSAA